MTQYALLSVSDKTGLIELARGLVECGFTLLASGGTATALRTVDCPVTEIAAWTGSPEILDGRVKTLHPKIHAGLLARRDDAAHRQALQAAGYAPIDVVIVNLYPFVATAARVGATEAEIIEQIDIGGPALLRSAAKNFQDVIVVCDPADYPSVVAALRQGTPDTTLRRDLARKVFAHVAAYDAAISNYFERAAEPEAALPARWSGQWERARPLRYGENPQQAAAWYREVGAATLVGEPLQGKELSYNNLLDADAALQLAAELREYPHAAVIVKHGNPCGVGVSETSLAEAYARALAADPVSAFGGIVAVTTPLDADTATQIASRFFEVVAAPTVTPEAARLLADKKALRVVPVEWPTAMQRTWQWRSAAGGCLVQEVDAAIEAASTWRTVTQRTPSAEELAALRLAWIVCKHVRSNAIVFASATATVGIGAGQMSRLDAVQVATMKWRQIRTEPSTDITIAAASDAFFPFRDGLDAIAATGIRALVQPGGSVRDPEVLAAADEHGMAMCLTGVRHFRH